MNKSRAQLGLEILMRHAPTPERVTNFSGLSQGHGLTKSQARAELQRRGLIGDDADDSSWLDVFASPWEHEAKENLKRTEKYINALNEDAIKAAQVPVVEIGVTSLTWAEGVTWALVGNEIRIYVGDSRAFAGLYTIVAVGASSVRVKRKGTEGLPVGTVIPENSPIGAGLTTFAYTTRNFTQPPPRGLLAADTKESPFYRWSRFVAGWRDFLRTWKGTGWNTIQASTVSDGAKQYRDEAAEWEKTFRAAGVSITETKPKDATKPPDVLGAVSLTAVAVVAVAVAVAAVAIKGKG